MIILAVDTSSREGSVALLANGCFSGPVRFGAVDSHLMALGRSVESLLEEHGLELKDVDRIALISGPGSFTGLRIGMAFVKGIHAALGMEVVTMTSLEIIARPLLKKYCSVCPMIDARKDEVYTALYRLNKKGQGEIMKDVLSPRVVAPQTFCEELEQLEEGPVLFAGSGAVRYRKLIHSAFGVQASFASGNANMISMSALAGTSESLQSLTSEEILTLEPFYIRSSDAELKRLKSHRTHGRN